MQIEEGKYYRTRAGAKAGPAVHYGHDPDAPSTEWMVRHANGHPATYYANGCRVGEGYEDPEDLIAEWTEDQHEGSVSLDTLAQTDVEMLTAATMSPAEALQELDLRERDTAEHEPPLRVQILHAGAGFTNGQRDVEYGPPAINMAAAGALKAAFRQHLRRDIDPAELEALDMVMTKLGRIATGAPKLDTYIDAATYFAIAGEIALTPTIEETLI